MPFIITLLLVAFVAIFILVQPSKVIYIRLLSIPALCILFILCLILLSNTAVMSALDGLRLWAGVVVPSLFPFFVAAEIMNSSGFIRASGLLLEPVMRPLFNVPGSGSFALAMGVISGYPVGAKITCDLKNNGEITKNEAERLLAFTNNSGPLFIIGAVGTGMFGSPQIGIFLFLCHLLACITVGFSFRFYKIKRNPANLILQKNQLQKGQLHSSRLRKINTNKFTSPLNMFKNRLLEENKHRNSDFGAILGNAIKNSVSTILTIGGFIVLFSVIIKLLTETGIIGSFAVVFSKILSPLGFDERMIEGVLSGFFEITTGSRLVSGTTGISLFQQLPAVSLIIGWAGLSVHFQVMSIASKTDVSIRPYVLGKLFQGILSALYTFFGLKWLRLDALLYKPVLSNHPITLHNWLHTFGTAIWMVLAIVLVFTVINTAGRLNAGFLKQR